MIIKHEIALADFEFWCGGAHNASLLTKDELDMIDCALSELYPSGLTPTEINDILWFDDDWIAELCGFQDFDTMYTERKFRYGTRTKIPYYPK